MNDALRREILSLIEAPELREYLAELADNLPCRSYAEIIAGAPTDLWKKQSLLSKLLTVTSSKDKGYVPELLQCLEAAIDALEQAEKLGIILSVELRGHDEQKRCTDCIDGPYLVKNLQEAQSAIRTYRAANNGDDWSTLFWDIELYDLSESIDPDGFRQPTYTFVCSSEGVPQYFFPKLKPHEKRPWHQQPFCSNDLDIPVPYQPGDILRIDCRPYEPTVFYCLIIQVRSGCCGIWCLFPNKDGSIGQGALKHGHYHEYDFFPQVLSPLYRAQVFNGELPRKCQFMKGLSEKIQANPSYENKVDEVFNDLRL